jgi:hypothetical protein
MTRKGILVRQWSLACVAFLACLVLMGGCVPPPPPEPPASAVLEGDWVTDTEEGGVAFVRFDELGVVVRIFAVTEEGATISIEVSDGSTTLEGSDVNIIIPTNEGEVRFEGTLSADQNTLEGEITREIVIGDTIVITIPQGDVTLTRAECTTDEECPGDQVCNVGVCEEVTTGPEDTFPTSLHFTREGKAHYYAEENGGFETLTGVPMTDLTCQQCHAATLADGTPVDDATYEPSCADCHADVDDPGANVVTNDICLGCHSRQKNEITFFDDVHRTAGMMCVRCHTAREMHGDGTAYVSQNEMGAMDAACEDCHIAGNDEGATVPTANAFHASHGILGDQPKLDCSACHVSSVISCYNCHFPSEVAGAGKRFLSPPRQGFKMLLNHEGKVHSATFQSLIDEDGETFYVLAPYYAHSVTKEGITCGTCHSNAAVNEYNDTGEITVALWDEDTRSLMGPTGVIPIPPDWQEALQFDFLDYTGDPTTPIPDTDPTLWQFTQTGADLTQMLFAEPLTASQMTDLSLNLGD